MPSDMRRRAALGELSPPGPERIHALLLLASDADPETRTGALATLEREDPGVLAAVLSDSATPRDVLDSALELPLLNREELIEATVRNPALLDPGPATADIIPAAAAETPSAVAAPKGPAKETTLQRIARMKGSEKLRAALTGSAEERLLLIRDANKTVARAVLMTPKITERELETYASMRNVAEEVLRSLATKRTFVRHYAVVRALVNNPRTPSDAVLPLLGRLQNRDLRALAVNRNVPDAVRHTAARMFHARQGS